MPLTSSRLCWITSLLLGSDVRESRTLRRTAPAHGRHPRLPVEISMRCHRTFTRRHLEIAGVLCAAGVHFLLTQAIGIHGLDIAPIALCCIAYAIWRGRDAGARAAWGIRRAGFRACSRDAALLVAAGTLFCAGWGLLRGTLVVDLHLLLPLLLYPVWGLAQQFLVLGLFAHNLSASGWPRPLGARPHCPG